VTATVGFSNGGVPVAGQSVSLQVGVIAVVLAGKASGSAVFVIAK
jgi:hypothetical protein